MYFRYLHIFQVTKAFKSDRQRHMTDVTDILDNVRYQAKRLALGSSLMQLAFSPNKINAVPITVLLVKLQQLEDPQFESPVRVRIERALNKFTTETTPVLTSIMALEWLNPVLADMGLEVDEEARQYLTSKGFFR